MKVKLIVTHNPQDFFQGNEDPDLYQIEITDADFPECISAPLDGGYCVILRKISGHISVTYRKAKQPLIQQISTLIQRIRWMIKLLWGRIVHHA